MNAGDLKREGYTIIANYGGNAGKGQDVYAPNWIGTNISAPTGNGGESPPKNVTSANAKKETPADLKRKGY
jgi:hypothetical protein